MNWILVRHHPALRSVSAKWLLVVLLSTTVWLGGITNRLLTDDLHHTWLWLAALWTAPAFYVVFGPHQHRCRDFALTLPIPAVRIWRTHALVVLITSGIVVAMCLGIGSLSLREIAARAPHATETIVTLHGQLDQLWLQLPAWWLAVTALVLADRPSLVQIPPTRGWVLRQLGLASGSVAGLAVLGRLGPASAAVPLGLAVAGFVLAGRRQPRVLSLAPREPLAAGRAAGATRPAARPQRWRRRPLWLVVLLATGKHPVLQLVLLLFLVLLGLALSDFLPAYASADHLGVLMIPITAYSLFAVASAPLRRLALFEYLPVARGRLLGILLVPQLVLIAAGYVGGEFLAAGRRPAYEPLSFCAEPDAYGVRVLPRYLAVTLGEIPVQVAPDGETIAPPPIGRLSGSFGPTIYKPYHTPLGASLDVCAWQLERASERIFDRAIPAAEFKERYLALSPEHVVIWRDGGDFLTADHPDLRLRGFPGLPPLQALLVGGLFLAVYGWYLTFFRPGVGEGWQKAAFVIGLAVLMALHLLPFVLAIAGVADPEMPIIVGFALSDWLVRVTPGGPWGLWIMVLAALAVGYRLVLGRFRRAEWPPVREDDAA